jgi:hypothetical protein
MSAVQPASFCLKQDVAKGITPGEKQWRLKDDTKLCLWTLHSSAINDNIASRAAFQSSNDA